MQDFNDSASLNGFRVIGDSEVGPRRAVALGVEDGRHHLHVVGKTGSGKSTLLANLALADTAAGRGVVLIDPKGDLIDELLARLPERALDRLVLIDPREAEAPPALNILSGEPAEVAVDHVVSVFARIFSAWWGPRTEDVLRSACSTLQRLPGATLADVPALLTDRRFRAPLVATVSERSGLKGFWDGYDALSNAGQAQVIGPIMNKLRAVLSRRFARDLFGSARSSFDMKEVLDGGVLLARLPKGTLGEDTARLVGALLVASVWQAATARADDAIRPDATLYVDEAHNFLALPTAVDDVLAEARGYHLSVVLAHQHLAQLPKDIFEAASANARNKVYFSVSPEDARVLFRHTEPYLKPYDLCHLDAYQVACRLVVGGRDLHAFTVRTRPMSRAVPGRAAEARKHARENAGRSLAERRHELLVRRRQHGERPAARLAAYRAASPPASRTASLRRRGQITNTTSAGGLPPRRRRTPTPGALHDHSFFFSAWRRLSALRPGTPDRTRPAPLSPPVGAPGAHHRPGLRPLVHEPRLHPAPAGRALPPGGPRPVPTAATDGLGLLALHPRTDRRGHRGGRARRRGTAAIGPPGPGGVPRRWAAHDPHVGGQRLFCKLHKAARERPNAAVTAWWSERRCAAEWGELVRPDAYGIWEEGGRRVEFFVEHDTGSEPLTRVAGKLAGYRDLAEADGTARPVFFWLAQPGREPGLRRALGGASVPVATAVAGTGNPADAVWLAVGDDAPRRRLTQLGALATGAGR